VAADGQAVPARLEEAAAAARAQIGSVVWLVGAVAVLLLLFFTSGLGARTGHVVATHRSAYLYVAPAMVGMILLVFFPFFYGIALSFTSQTIYSTDKSIPDIWIGLQNFKDIITDVRVAQHSPEGWAINYQNFYWTLWVTVAWTVSNVAIGVTVGLMLALILNIKGLRFRPIYRVLLILPWAVPNYITALIWKGMFHQQFGVVNQVLQMVGMEPVSWFEKPFTSFLACLATNGWLSFPFMMVISLGALQSIPADLYEAARVDGASRWRQFTSITLPSLKPALVPAVILSVVWTFNMFNIIYLVSAGEPAHSTEILITQAYKLAFEQYRYGYAAAYSTVIFGILLLYGTWQNRVTKATEGI
jgi:arabinogalactan oligomer/maltooligosaccharide transport system permease protein